MMIECYSSVRCDDMMNNVYDFLWRCGMTLVLCINDDDVEMSMTIYVNIRVMLLWLLRIFVLMYDVDFVSY